MYNSKERVSLTLAAKQNSNCTLNLLINLPQKKTTEMQCGAIRRDCHK